VVAKQKQRSKQTKKLATAKQEGKLKPRAFILKAPTNIPKDQMKDSKVGRNKKPTASCKSCGVKGHISTNCYYRMREDKIQWTQIPYNKPGNKPLTRKEQKRQLRVKD
jgi:hypothetical protein